MKPSKGRKFDSGGSDRTEKREFNRSSRPEKRDFSKYSKSEYNKPEFDRRDSDRSSSKDSGFKLYHAICDKCGVECDVPFKPTGNKPIYCRSCFRAGASESGGRSNSFDRGRDTRSESRGRYDERPETKSAPSISKEDMDKINRKLDKIMNALKID
jgi:CxxC-x17-CxxC domain-containing protein